MGASSPVGIAPPFRSVVPPRYWTVMTQWSASFGQIGFWVPVPCVGSGSTVTLSVIDRFASRT